MIVVTLIFSVIVRDYTHAVPRSPPRMSLETQQSRTAWLNAVLEAHIAGEAFSGLAAKYIAEATAADSPLSSSAAPSLLSTLVSGDYLSVLTGAPHLSAGLFARAVSVADATAPDQLVPALTAAISAWIDEGDVELASSPSDVTEREERDTFCLLAGVAALAAFTQVNTAGLPLVAPASSAPAPAAWGPLSALLAPARARAIAASLRANGEDVYPSLYHPALLLLARVLLAALPAARVFSSSELSSESAPVYTASASSFTAPAARLWALRALAAHDAALLDSAASVAQAATAVLRSIEGEYLLGAVAGAGARGGLAGAGSDVDPTAEPAAAAANGVIPASAAFAAASTTRTTANAGTEGDYDGDEEGVEEEDGEAVLAGSVSRGMVPSASAATALSATLTTASAVATAAAATPSWSRPPAVLRRSVCATACLEAAALARAFWKHALSRRLLSAAAAAAGGAAALTGVAGKRTRYQRTATAQLVLVGAAEADMVTLPAEAEGDKAAAAVAVHMGASPAAVVAATTATAAAAAAAAAAGGLGGASAPAGGEYVPDAPLDNYDDTLLAIPAIAASARSAGVALLRPLATTAAGATAAAAGKTAASGTGASGTEAVEGVFTSLGLAAALAHAEHIRSAQATGEVATGEALAFVYAPLVQELRRAGYDDSLESHVTDGVTPSASPAAKMTTTVGGAAGTACKGACAGKGDCASAGTGSGSVPVMSRTDLMTRPTWSTAAHSLYLRSLLEQADYRRQTRSFAQLESLGALYPPSLAAIAHGDAPFSGPVALSDGSRNAAADAPRPPARPLSLPAVRWRMEGIFASGLRPWWLSRRGYAEIAAGAGLRQAALDVFVQIGLWEQVIETYVALGRNALAESLLRSRLPRGGWLEGASEANNAAAAAFVAATTAAAAGGAGAGGIDDNEEEELGGDVPPIAFSAPVPAPGAHPAATRAPNAPADAEEALRARFASIAADTSTTDSSSSNDSSSKGGVSVSSASASLQRKGLDLPEHKLWGLLADVRREPALYAKAWQVSGGTYPRAQRSLGTLAMAKHAFAAAYEHFSLALEVNPSNPEIWFAAGACALELRRWDDAIRCFSATVNGKPDYSEAWNNLAAAHLHKGNTRAAFSALEHTVRLYRKSWKVWENYLNCAMALGKHQQAANAMSTLADLRGTTDAKTLIPIQFSTAQSQLHMMCLAELTRAAVEEARGSFKATAAAHATALAAGGVAAAAAAAEASVLEQSYLCHKMLQVLGKYATIAASVSSQEAALGGRKRGGGEAAGAGNSVTAQVQLRERVRREKLVRAAEAAAAAAGEAATKGGAEGGVSGPEDEDEAPSADDNGEGEDEDADEADDSVGELPSLAASAAAAAAAAVLPSSTSAASSSAGLFDSLGQQYQVLVSDCLGRVHAAVQQYAPAAAACEARLALLLKASGWASRPEVIEEIVAALEDAVRYYGLAVEVEKHLEAASAAGAAGAVKGEAAATATAARLFVSRTQAALALAAKNASNPTVLAAAASRAEALLARVQSWVPAPAAVAAPAAADPYDAYGGGGYDDWR